MQGGGGRVIGAVVSGFDHYAQGRFQEGGDGFGDVGPVQVVSDRAQGIQQGQGAFGAGDRLVGGVTVDLAVRGMVVAILLCEVVGRIGVAVDRGRARTDDADRE